MLPLTPAGGRGKYPRGETRNPPAISEFHVQMGICDAAEPEILEMRGDAARNAREKRGVVG